MKLYLDKILDNEPVFEKVEDFIKKLHEHDIQLNEKAQKFMVPLPKSGVFGKTTEEHALSDIIAKEMAHYQRILYSENISNKRKTLYKKAERQHQDNRIHGDTESH